MGVVDAFIAYKFIKILVTPFEETDAYKLGIIDANGKVLKKRKDLRRSEETKAYTIIHTLCWNIKKILVKLQVGKSRIGSLAAALYFLKEELEKLDVDPNTVEDGVYAAMEYMNIDKDNIKHMALKESFASPDVIEPGTYVIDGDMVEIKESLTSFDTMLDIPLFVIHSNDKKYIFSRDDLKES